jgi:S-DNA-T family DNA segregation ATPase FtsK/SpoIIIE
MYTWKTDQDKVLQFSWEIIMQGDLTVSNWLGRLGAFISNAFFYWGFGLPSIAFVFLLFKLGTDFIKKRSLQLFFYKAKDALLWIAFLSLVLEFLFRGSDFTWGGAFGESACLWLINFVGSVGLFFLLLFSLVGFVIWQFNPQLSQIQAMLPGGEKMSLDTIPFAETINRFLSSMSTIGSEEKVAK